MIGPQQFKSVVELTVSWLFDSYANAASGSSKI